jgi:hypothetical protein
MDAEPATPNVRALAVTLSLDDYYAFQKEICRPTLRLTSADKPLLAGLWLLLVVLFVALFQSRAATGRDLVVAIATCFLVLGVARLFRARMRAQLAPAPDGALLGDSRIELSELRLRVISRHAETQLSWSAVRELRETPMHLFLMLDRAQALILPKRFLGDDAAIWALRSLLAQRITMGKSSAARAVE